MPQRDSLIRRWFGVIESTTYGTDEELTPREDLDGRPLFRDVAVEFVLTLVPLERVKFLAL